jgi:hypothetical protein
MRITRLAFNLTKRLQIISQKSLSNTGELLTNANNFTLSSATPFYRAAIENVEVTRNSITTLTYLTIQQGLKTGYVFVH